jgi:hypothetical protein
MKDTNVVRRFSGGVKFQIGERTFSDDVLVEQVRPVGQQSHARSNREDVASWIAAAKAAGIFNAEANPLLTLTAEGADGTKLTMTLYWARMEDGGRVAGYCLTYRFAETQ